MSDSLEPANPHASTRAKPFAGDQVTSGVRVRLKRVDPDVPVPAYALPGDAGADLVTTMDADLGPGDRAVLPTGVAIALPPGYAAFVHPRSGLAARVGLSLVNSPGTIDAGYRGEIKVIAVNLDPVHRIQLRRGERIAQLVVQRVEQAVFEVVDELPGSVRGGNGHGSTGGSDALLTPEARPVVAPGDDQPRWMMIFNADEEGRN